MLSKPNGTPIATPRMVVGRRSFAAPVDDTDADAELVGCDPTVGVNVIDELAEGVS